MTMTATIPNCNPAEQFPEERMQKMQAFSSQYCGPLLRTDSLSPVALAHLNVLDPALAFFIATNNTTQLKYHRDAAETVFYARSLEHIRPGLLDVLFPDLEGMKFVPMEGGVDPGAEQFTYRGQRKIGRAKLIKSYADDLPKAEIVGIESVQPIRGFGDSYAYTSQEIRASMLAGIPVDIKKAMAARYAIALIIDETIFYGNAEGGLFGLLNQTATTPLTDPNGTAGFKLWRKKTPDEIVADMHGVVNNVVKVTSGIHRPNAMILPLAAYNIAATRRMGDGSNMTALQFFLATSPYIQSVDPSYRLDASNSALWNNGTATGLSRGVVYEKNSERMALVLPVEFEQAVPFIRHFVTETACHARTAGVVNYYQGHISYFDGVTDTSD